MHPVRGQLDRALHIQLLNQLFAQHARAVVFDVLFDEPSKDKEADKQLAAAIKAHGRVVLGASCYYSGGDGEPIVGHARTPSGALATAAPWGVAELPKDSDGIVRRHFYDGQYTNLAWPAAALIGEAPSDNGKQRWIN